MNTKGRLFGLAVLAMFALGGCGGNQTVREEYSGSWAAVKPTRNIPHVPASNGPEVTWSREQIDQLLYLDEDCQKQLIAQLPGIGQAVGKEGLWGAGAVALGEAWFASMFPGALVAKYAAGGLGLGFATGSNSGRLREEASVKIAQAGCVSFQVQSGQKKYGILPDVGIIQWQGNGKTKLPVASQ